MKPAIDYINEIFEVLTGKLTDEEIAFLINGDDDESKMFRLFSIKLNEARKDTIYECAERAKSVSVSIAGHYVDKNSILKIIDELK